LNKYMKVLKTCGLDIIFNRRLRLIFMIVNQTFVSSNLIS
jgi:hypothetical protein